ncbi:hypothetical protein [Nitrospirillum bahiense]|uniref:hypothetical protein n=1 Tax=Nitrospirillum amazonense TaxID=28077 RepID=UPI0011A6025A|nr:hypothetical protein [Nitrospirillum amazonense]
MTSRVWVSASAFLLVFGLSGQASAGPLQSDKESCRKQFDVAYAALYGTAQLTDVLANGAPDFPYVLEKVGPENYKTLPLREKSDFWKLGWKGEAPTPEIIHVSYASKHRALAERCIKDRTKPHPIGSLRNERYALYKPTVAPYVTNYGPLEVRIAAPIINYKGTQALVFYDVGEIKGLGGSNGIVFLRMRDGTWDVVGRRILSDS